MKHKSLPCPVETEWAYVRKALSCQQAVAIMSRHVEPSLQHDFMMIDGKLYAMANQSFGKGGYGKVVWVQDEAGERFVCKMTFPEGVYKEMPFPESLFKRMGFIKGVTELNDYEQRTLFGLGVAKQGGFKDGAHITVMKPLGLPLADHIAENQVDEKKALKLALKTVRAVYDFHTGFSDKAGKARLHNDIKPGNVLIDPATETISLIDFSECFEIDKYDAMKIYRHPRPTSFEPFIAAPEVRYQTGPWYKPWQQYRHTNRFLSVKSDVYLLGSVLKPLLKKNKKLNQIRRCIMHPDRSKRPIEPILLIVLMVLCDAFNQSFDSLKSDYQHQLPGFDAFMDIDETQAKVIATCFFLSNKEQIYYDTNSLLVVLKDKPLCRWLETKYAVTVDKVKHKQSRVARKVLADYLIVCEGGHASSAVREKIT